MTTDRPYHKELDKESATKEFRKEANSKMAQELLGAVTTIQTKSPPGFPANFPPIDEVNSWNRDYRSNKIVDGRE